MGAGVVLSTGPTLGACESNLTLAYGGALAVGFDGSVPSACSGEEAFKVPASACGALSCPVPYAYALCDGTSFTECNCTVPDGWDIVACPDGGTTCDVLLDAGVNTDGEDPSSDCGEWLSDSGSRLADAPSCAPDGDATEGGDR